MSNPIDMSRAEAIDLAAAAVTLINDRKYGSLALLLGMTDDMIEGLSLAEIIECVGVRVSDLFRRAGIPQ